MKLMHLGDLHLGKSLNEFNLIEDQRFILDRLLSIAEQEAVDGVMICGDVYDRAVPGEAAVALLDAFLTKLKEAGKTVFMISGNHDSDERLNFGSRIFENSGIHIAGRYDGEMGHVEVSDEYGPLHVWMLPFVKASRVRHFFPEETIDNYDDAVRTVIRRAGIDPSLRNVILAHQFVAGPSDPETAGSETALATVGTVEKIGWQCFEDFDYTALGHIHKSQPVGKETIRYAGSPLRYSLDEKELADEKAVTLVELKEKGDVQIMHIPLKPRREIRHIRGTLDNLLAHAEDPGDYIYATLTDDRPQFDAMTRLQQVYPNTMKLDYDNESIREAMDGVPGDAAEEKGISELIREFYRWILGQDPTEEEMAVLLDAAEEAEVIE